MLALVVIGVPAGKEADVEAAKRAQQVEHAGVGLTVAHAVQHGAGNGDHAAKLRGICVGVGAIGHILADEVENGLFQRQRVAVHRPQLRRGLHRHAQALLLFCGKPRRVTAAISVRHAHRVAVFKRYAHVGAAVVVPVYAHADAASHGHGVRKRLAHLVGLPAGAGVFVEEQPDLRRARVHAGPQIVAGVVYIAEGRRVRQCGEREQLREQRQRQQQGKRAKG